MLTRMGDVLTAEEAQTGPFYQRPVPVRRNDQ